MKFDVELRPFTGMARGQLGEFPVVHAADIVCVKGAEIVDQFGREFIEVGYVGHQESSIEFLPVIRDLGRGAADEVARQAGLLTGKRLVSHLTAEAVDLVPVNAMPELDGAAPPAVPEL